MFLNRRARLKAEKLGENKTPPIAPATGGLFLASHILVRYRGWCDAILIRHICLNSTSFFLPVKKFAAPDTYNRLALPVLSLFILLFTTDIILQN
jgi:hypothetical protein